jgi:hypothetical protein
MSDYQNIREETYRLWTEDSVNGTVDSVTRRNGHTRAASGLFIFSNTNLQKLFEAGTLQRELKNKWCNWRKVELKTWSPKRFQ